MRAAAQGAWPGGDQLVDGVERQVLQPGDAVQIGWRGSVPATFRDAPPYGRRGSGTGLPSSGAVGVEQAVVHRPGSIPTRPSGRPRRLRLQTVEHAPVQGEDVPVQGRADPYGRLAKRCTSVRSSGPASPGPPSPGRWRRPGRRRRRPADESEGSYGGCDTVATSGHSRGTRRAYPSAQPCGAAARRRPIRRTRRAQRRNAAATPASTGTCSPVV